MTLSPSGQARVIPILRSLTQLHLQSLLCHVRCQGVGQGHPWVWHGTTVLIYTCRERAWFQQRVPGISGRKCPSRVHLKDQPGKWGRCRRQREEGEQERAPLSSVKDWQGTW